MEKQKIDFVITWVDGNDLNWQKEKAIYKPETRTDNRNVRYREWDNLKYWFRAVEQYAPWVNKIYFVTWGHLPEWLDTRNEKLVIVNHKDFIPKEYLPTFNSCSIEMNLHRIKNLSDNFVYFNDDVFLLDKVKETDFFKNNLPCDSAVLSAIIPSGADDFEHTLVNNINIINKYFNMKQSIKNNPSKWFNLKYGKDQIRTLLLMGWNNFPGIRIRHIPASLTKKVFNELWDKEYGMLNSTSLSKFRNTLGVNPWVLQDYFIASGDFYPRSTKFGKLMDVSNVKEIKEAIEKKKYKTICINDNSKIEDFENIKKEINSSFEKNLPNKSSFEK